MVKKGLIVGAAVALLAVLFATPFTRSYVMTWWEDGKQFVNELESTKHQIKRARTMIKDLDQPIRNCEHLVAKADVELEGLEANLADVKTDLDQRYADIMRLKSHLDNGGGTFVVADRSYSEDRVEEDLELRFAKYRTREATRDNLEQVIDARRKGVQAARKKLEEMRAAKGTLIVEVENLESRLTMIEAKQAASDINVDDSALAQTKELVQSIKTRLDVADKMLNSDTEVHDLIPLDNEEAKADSNISARITEYFEEKQASDGNIDLANASS
jgi:chromosome segregation ATPase